MSAKTDKIRGSGKAAYSLTPLTVSTLLLMVVFGVLVGWLAGRMIGKQEVLAAETEVMSAGLSEDGEWQDFLIDCEAGFYNIILKATEPLPEGVISFSINSNLLVTTFIPSAEDDEAAATMVSLNVEFPACTNETLRTYFENGGVEIESVELQTGYESWTEQFADLPDDPAADSDSDGLSNLEEYMMGGNPLDAEDTGFQPVLREEKQVVYALANDPRIEYQAMASVSSNNVDFSADNLEYVGSKPFGDTMRVHLSVLDQPCEMVTLDLNYIWDVPQN